jgi:hypothetical protein
MMNEEHKQLAKTNVLSGIKWGIVLSVLPIMLQYTFNFLF